MTQFRAVPADPGVPFDEAQNLALPSAAGIGLAAPPRLFVLRDVVATAFLRRGALLLCFLVPVAAGAAAALLAPTRFTAEGLLIVLGSRESAGAADISGYGATVLSVDQPKVVQSEINILTSDDVVGAVVRAIGPAVLYPAVARPRLLGLLPATPEDLQVQRATELFERDLHADVEPNSAILRVQFTYPDRALAMRALGALLDTYLARRQVILGRGTAQFLAGEVERVEARLAATAREIQAVKAGVGVLDLGQAIQLASSRVDGLERRADAVREQQAGSLAQLDGARARLQQQQGRVFASQETTNQAANDDTRNTLLKLQIERDHLAAQYTPAYPPLAELDRKIATVQAAVAAGSRTAFSTTREIRNPVVDQLTGRVVGLQVETGALDKQLVELERQLADARARANALLAAESRLAELGRRQAADDAIFRQFAGREAGARIEEAARQTSNANVHVVQTPVAPVTGRSLALSFAALGVLAGGLAAAAAAVVLTWLRRSFASPAEAERGLMLPALASFDLGERFDPRATSPAVAGLAAMLLDIPAGPQPVCIVQFVPASAAEDGFTAQLVRAAAIELARGWDRKTLLVDLKHDGREHLAMLGAQPLAAMGDGAPIQAMNTVFPRLWVAFDAASGLADNHTDAVRLRRIMDDLRNEFDRVLVIGSAELDSYATRRFTVMADANVVVVRGEQTSGPAARRVRDTVLGAGGTLLGFVYGGRRDVVPPAVARLL